MFARVEDQAVSEKKLQLHFPKYYYAVNKDLNNINWESEYQKAFTLEYTDPSSPGRSMLSKDAICILNAAKEGDLYKLASLDISGNAFLCSADNNYLKAVYWALYYKHQHILDCFYALYFKKNLESEISDWELNKDRKDQQYKFYFLQDSFLYLTLVFNQIKAAEEFCSNYKITDKVLLFKAAEIGNWHYVENLLLQDRFLIYKDELDDNDYGLLHYAAQHGYVSSINLLLTLKINQDTKSSRDKPLEMAVGYSNYPVLDILLKNKTNEVTSDGTKIIKRAAGKGCLATVKLLLKHFHVKKVYEPYMFSSPLYSASFQGHYEVSKLFLKLGLRLHDHELSVIISRAVMYDNLEITKLFKPYTDLKKIREHHDDNLLHIAANNSNLNTLKFLLNEGLEVDLVNEYGESALHIACRQGKLLHVQLLVFHGANINLQSKFKESCLHEATGSWNVKIVKFLLMNGADITCADRNNKTPFHKLIYFCIYNYKKQHDLMKIFLPFLNHNHKAICKDTLIDLIKEFHKDRESISSCEERLNVVLSTIELLENKCKEIFRPLARSKSAFLLFQSPPSKNLLEPSKENLNGKRKGSRCIIS